jgi:hypothetical protein
MSETSRTPRSTGLNRTQFSKLNSAGINDPGGPEKYNNTEVKYGAIFYSCHTADLLQYWTCCTTGLAALLD